MFPRLADHYHLDVGLDNAVFLRQFPLMDTTRSVSSTNLPNRIIGQLSRCVSLTVLFKQSLRRAMSAFGVSVYGIIKRGTREDMIRPNALGIVAGMASKHPFRKGETVSYLPRKMSSRAIEVVSFDSAIALSTITGPKPTSIRLLDTRPEEGQQIGNRLEAHVMTNDERHATAGQFAAAAFAGDSRGWFGAMVAVVKRFAGSEASAAATKTSADDRLILHRKLQSFVATPRSVSALPGLNTVYYTKRGGV